MSRFPWTWTARTVGQRRQHIWGDATEATHPAQNEQGPSSWTGLAASRVPDPAHGPETFVVSGAATTTVTGTRRVATAGFEVLRYTSAVQFPAGHSLSSVAVIS